MKIATFNVNGINGRLPVLLRWLESSTPDVVCLQELKAPQEKFPQAALARLGYGSIWHGQKSWNGVAILARDADPIETRRALPGEPDDAHSRYIEATVRGIIVGCLYLPNGNPAPGPKFDYKLRWFERLIVHASELFALNAPVALAGEMARIGPAEVRKRYGVGPRQVPDFIALRGDASDRIPGAKGIGEKGAASILRRYGSLENAIAAGRFPAQAEKLRLYRSIAIMDRSAPLPALPDQKPTWSRAAALARDWQLKKLAERLTSLADHL